MTANNKKNIPDELVKHHYSKLVLDSQFEAFFDSITDLTSRLLDVPIALVTFVNEETIWVQSQAGFQIPQTLHNRKRFCGIFPQDRDLFQISDTDLDVTHENHLFLIDGKKAKFYAGVKIKLPLGEMIGVLCVFDVAPRTLTVMQRDYLIGMARIIEKALVTKNFLHRVI